MFVNHISLAIASFLSSVAAHGYLTSPAAEFLPGVMNTNFVGTIESSNIFQGKFNDNPQANAKTFAIAFRSSNYKSLRQLVESYGPMCGNTKINVQAKRIPSDGAIVWENPDTREGFIPSHTGPCEVWIDEQRVFYNDNCAAAFPSRSKARIPIDFSTCRKQKCLLRFYWLALHQPTWQVYKNCVPIVGKSVQPRQ